MIGVSVFHIIVNMGLNILAGKGGKGNTGLFVKHAKLNTPYTLANIRSILMKKASVSLTPLQSKLIMKNLTRRPYRYR